MFISMLARRQCRNFSILIFLFQVFVPQFAKVVAFYFSCASCLLLLILSIKLKVLSNTAHLIYTYTWFLLKQTLIYA